MNKKESDNDSVLIEENINKIDKDILDYMGDLE